MKTNTTIGSTHNNGSEKDIFNSKGQPVWINANTEVIQISNLSDLYAEYKTIDDHRFNTLKKNISP